MKRSEINSAIALAHEYFAKFNFNLPTWGYWSPENWNKISEEASEIIESNLGWDITDFGLGNFSKIGLTLFTLRNGNLKQPANKKSYAEKIMLAQKNQVTPLHFHWLKMEDIINRGGGDLIIKLYKADAFEVPDKQSDIYVAVDGIVRKVSPGGTVLLKPGESITLTPYLYHEFWAENDHCIIGEVSSVNDDATDNRFFEPIGRFPRIEEDTVPLRLLCNELPKLIK